MKPLKKPSSFCFVLVSGTVIAVALRLVLTGTLLEAKYGVYQRGTVLPTLYHIALALFAVGLIIFGYLHKKELSTNTLNTVSNQTVFAAGLSSFLLIAETGSEVIRSFKQDSLTVMTVILVLFGSLSAVWFIFQTKHYPKPVPLNAWFSFAPMIWSAILILDIYFDKTALIVSPNKILHQIALLFTMLAFLAESHSAVGLDKPALAVICDSLAVFFLSVSSIPNLLMPASLFVGTSDTYLRYVVEFAIGLFFAARLSDRIRSHSKKTEALENREESL